MDELAAAEGAKKAADLYQQKVESQGPLECASPAIADGKLFVRLKNALACYNLTEPEAVLAKN